MRSYKGDGRGVMGFFVVAFVRDGEDGGEREEEPYVRDEEGMIVSDEAGMPMLRATGEFVPVPEEGRGEAAESDDDESGSDASGSDSGSSGSGSDETEDEEAEWGGFDD